MGRRVTIKDVAGHSGVSFQTVSRVINGAPDVAPDTRERVLASVRTLNYLPNRTARALSQEKTFAIVVALPVDTHGLLAQPHLLAVLDGVDREASLRDYNILLATRRGDRPAVHQQLIQRMVVDGAIVDGGRGDAPVLGQAGELGADAGPIVVTGYTESGLPCVHPDDEGGAYIITQHLIALRHRRIALIGGTERTYPGMWARRVGYERALRDARLPVDPALMSAGDFTVASGHSGAATLMELADPPTAIFALNDGMALGAMRWLRDHGHGVPDDVSVVGFNDDARAEVAEPPLTTVRLPSEELGRRAAMLLFDLIDGLAPEPREVVIPCHLIVRGSASYHPGRSEGDC